MPLVRFEVKNEYGLGDRELYKEKEQPRAILDGVVVAGLVGILRQLGDLAEFAADIFHDLHEQMMTTTARGRKMLSRIQRIESALPSLEKAIQGQRDYIRFAYTAGCDWHANVQTDQSQLLCSDLPQFMIDFYEECRDRPRLYLLDKFDSSGAGACLKRYSDPSYFKRALASSEAVKADKVRRKKKKRRSRRNRGIQHALVTYRDSNSTQFASPSTDHINFSGVNISFSDTRSKSELANFDSQTTTNCVEQVSDSPHKMPGEQEYSCDFSAPASENDNDNASSSVLHGEPRQDIADDDSQPESLQQQSASGTSSVKWDEKTEIVKSTGASSYGDEFVDRNIDLDCHPQIFDTSDISKVGTDNQDDIVFELAKAPVSYPCGNVFDEVPTGTYNFMDATDLEHEKQRGSVTQTEQELKFSNSTYGDLEHEIQRGSESQTEQELKSSNHTYGDLEYRTCTLNETSATDSDFFDAQASMASCSSLNKFVLSDDFEIDHVQSESTCQSSPSVGSGYSKSHVPSVPGISSPDTLMDKTNTSEPELGRDSKCQTKRGLEFSNFNYEDLEPRTCSSNETSATNSDCFYAQLPIVSCKSLNNFVLSDGFDLVQWANTSCQTPDSDSSVGTGYSKSHIPCEPGINVSELLDGDQSPELSIAHEQDVLVGNETPDVTSKSQYFVTDTSNPSPVCFWTNGGILGVEPSKPSDFSINANPKAVDTCNESKTRSSIAVEERDQYGSLHVRKNCKDSRQGALMSDLGKYQEAEKDVTASESDLSAICNNISHSSGSDKNLEGISTKFSGLAQKFLSNSLHRRILVAQAGLSTSSQLVNADFRKLQEILRQDHKELPKRVPNALCEPETKEYVEVGSLGKPAPFSSAYLASSSPPLEHMKISFHPMNGLETSKLKLEFSSGNLQKGSEDLVFPFFQLIPEPSMTIQDSASESDDDTFCRSSVYSFDDLHSLNSEPELWGGDERSEREKHRLSDNSCRISTSTTFVCASTKFEQKDKCSIAFELEHLEVEKGKISDSIRDHPLVNSVTCDRNKKEEICEPPLFNSMYSTFHSPNELMPHPPLPPLQWRAVKQSDMDHSAEDKNSSCMKVVDHLDAQSQSIFTHKQQEQKEPRAQYNAGAGTYPSMNGDQQLPTASRGPYHNYNSKEQNEREDQLYQIRSKSFDLRCAITAKPQHNSELGDNIDDVAIIERAHAFS